MPGQGAYAVYIIRCADGSYYTGMTSDLRLRIAEHEQGLDPKAYTYPRRSLLVVWSEEFGSHDEAFRCEQQIKGWRREKKETLIRGNTDALPELARGGSSRR